MLIHNTSKGARLLALPASVWFICLEEIQDGCTMIKVYTLQYTGSVKITPLHYDMFTFGELPNINAIGVLELICPTPTCA